MSSMKWNAPYSQNEKSDEKGYRCSKCNSPFEKLLELVEHFNKDHDQTSPKCPLCPNKDYKAMYNVKQHVRDVHLKKVEDSEKLQCQYCPYTCLKEQEKSFKTHLSRFHSDEYHDDEIRTEEFENTNYSCSKCNENFSDLLKVRRTVHI